MRFAIDTGGTFTDLVVEDESGELRIYKSLTTPANPVEGVLDVLAIAASDAGLSLRDFLGHGTMLVHGTTRATNAILTGSTAKTAFFTTKGHPDILLFREGGRSDLFNWTRPYPQPYVPRSLTFEIPERIGAGGEVVVPLDEEAVRSVVRDLPSRNVEAVGVCLLWSIVNPIHEKRVGEILHEELGDRGVAVTLSHELNPTIREYRRAASACIDASLKPLMSRYLGGLEGALREAGFGGRVLVVTSSGGLLDVADVARAPIHSIGSGPAMAPVAGRAYAMADAESLDAVVADTGGTSFDVSLVRRGEIPSTRETWLGEQYFGHMTGFPSIDVRSIGAGGGSIAWVDEAGMLHVGPASAGSMPGPACYGRGGDQPTLTDAALVLAYLDPEYFLGGAMQLNAAAAWEAIERNVASPLGLSAKEAAAAVITVATEQMTRAIVEVTVNQGVDPRLAALVAGGGAAGLNAVAVGRRLGSPIVLLPDTGATLSACGGLLGDLVSEHSATHPTTIAGLDRQAVDETLAELKERCEAFISGPGASAVASRIEVSVEARYVGQNWEIRTPLERQRLVTDDDVSTFRVMFDRVHRELFSYSDPESDVELLSFHSRAVCRLRDQEVRPLPARAKSEQLLKPRVVYFPEHGEELVEILRFEEMEAGSSVPGPVIVESPVTTVVVDPGAVVERRRTGTLAVVPAAGTGEMSFAVSSGERRGQS